MGGARGGRQGEGEAAAGAPRNPAPQRVPQLSSPLLVSAAALGERLHCETLRVNVRGLLH